MGSIIRDSIQAVGTAKKLGWADVTFVGQAASYDPIGGSARRHHGGLLLRHRHALRARRHLGRADQGLGSGNTTRTNQDPNSAAQYGYVTADIVVKALEAAGKDLTRAKLVTAMEAVKGYKPMFPGPDINYGPDRRQARRLPFLAKVEGGRWKVVGENLLY